MPEKRRGMETGRPFEKKTRFLRPSELYANDHRAAVRASHPTYLDRAVRTHLSNMWKAADESTRAFYVKKAKEEREKYRDKTREKVLTVFQLLAPPVIIPPVERHTSESYRLPRPGPYVCQGKQFSLDGREWLVSDTIDPLLDIFERNQLEHAQKMFRAPNGLILLPTKAPNQPQQPHFMTHCIGGEIIFFEHRLWYKPRHGERLTDMAFTLATLKLPPHTTTTAPEFITVLGCVETILPPISRQALIDELYLEQLALLPMSLDLPTAYTLQTSFYLLPATTAWPQPQGRTTPAVIGVLPPNIQPLPAADIVCEANGRAWINIQRALSHHASSSHQTHDDQTLFSILASFAQCDSNTLSQLNLNLPPGAPFALLSPAVHHPHQASPYH